MPPGIGAGGAPGPPDAPADPGRGLNVFKVLQQIFRASITAGQRPFSLPGLTRDHGEKARMGGLAIRRSGQSPEPLTPTLCPLRLGEGVRQNPGRGFNLFKVLQWIFRALVTAKPLLERPFRRGIRPEGSRRAATPRSPAAGGGAEASVRPRAAVQPNNASSTSNTRAGDTRTPSIFRLSIYG